MSAAQDLKQLSEQVQADASPQAGAVRTGGCVSRVSCISELLRFRGFFGEGLELPLGPGAALKSLNSPTALLHPFGPSPRPGTTRPSSVTHCLRWEPSHPRRRADVASVANLSDPEMEGRTRWGFQTCMITCLGMSGSA